MNIHSLLRSSFHMFQPFSNSVLLFPDTSTMHRYLCDFGFLQDKKSHFFFIFTLPLENRLWHKTRKLHLQPEMETKLNCEIRKFSKSNYLQWNVTFVIINCFMPSVSGSNMSYQFDSSSPLSENMRGWVLSISYVLCVLGGWAKINFIQLWMAALSMIN